MNFKEFIEGTSWPMPWPVRQGVGEDPHEEDSQPEMEGGDYVLYHGTNMPNAEKILANKTIKCDNWHCVGVNTTPSAAQTFASMKSSASKNIPSVVLKIIVKKEWLIKQEITREVGGSGKDQWLIRSESMPPEAIKNISIYTVWGARAK